MNVLVCLTQADADAYSAAVDSKLGYPKRGVNISQIPVDLNVVGVTQRYADVIKHPTLAKWSYQGDVIGDSLGVARPVGSVDQVQTPDWIPVVAVT